MLFDTSGVPFGDPDGVTKHPKHPPGGKIGDSSAPLRGAARLTGIRMTWITF